MEYAKVVCLKRAGEPKPRMTRLGYTVRAGSPTCFMVQLDGETIWRRVYVLCFSNTCTHFVRVRGKNLIVRLD